LESLSNPNIIETSKKSTKEQTKTFTVVAVPDNSVPPCSCKKSM